jgi:hypothetical protein
MTTTELHLPSRAIRLITPVAPFQRGHDGSAQKIELGGQRRRTV